MTRESNACTINKNKLDCAASKRVMRHSLCAPKSKKQSAPSRENLAAFIAAQNPRKKHQPACKQRVLLKPFFNIALSYTTKASPRSKIAQRAAHGGSNPAATRARKPGPLQIDWPRSSRCVGLNLDTPAARSVQKLKPIALRSIGSEKMTQRAWRQLCPSCGVRC